jgi:hypothetical protein
MAKVYSAPEEFEVPDIVEFYRNKKFDEYGKACEEYKQKIKDFCKKNSPSKSDLVGEVYSHQYADGYAQYVVFQTSPLELIHLPLGDAWNIDAATMRGLRVSDIKSRIRRISFADLIKAKA